jgi:hypothetical protein
MDVCHLARRILGLDRSREFGKSTELLGVLASKNDALTAQGISIGTTQRETETAPRPCG